jgi:predicted RNA-binding Zn ribbon-like protein
MNTVWADRIGLHDALTNVDDLRAFLISVDMDTGTTVTLKRVADFRRLRDALRRIAMTVAGVNSEHARSAPAEAEAVDAINATLDATPPWRLRRTAAGWELERAEGDAVDAALACLARQGAELVADVARPLRACRAPGCVLFFVRDHPRREWCSVMCGNRVRAARHYRRLRAARP